MDETRQAVNAFVEAWAATPEGNRQGFVRLQELLMSKKDVQLAFHPRPGVTYSLRASVPGQERPLFVMVDVIEDQPRWLSVCFFGDMVRDPEERGAFVPGGLLGQDALCFDLEACTAEALSYVEARIEDAYAAAVGR
ncbi:hypothetical protein Despr_1939 [Desulfobulbus propionicus DSM 2032]|uniref:DUF5655 domain-containing protein n=2 Tax=Desulfobulbus propionicus TaxID=894 RepID=A0A7U4DPK8_DESPD|nr:hypothetical protein Despr_1939 [Desulfobulbus propionicus DSM 2032]